MRADDRWRQELAFHFMDRRRAKGLRHYAIHGRDQQIRVAFGYPLPRGSKELDRHLSLSRPWSNLEVRSDSRQGLRSRQSGEPDPSDGREALPQLWTPSGAV